MSATNSVLSNDTSITLDWADVSGANLYHLQVASTPDFSGSLISEDSALASSTKTFTDGGADNTKRWWRWRSSADSGTTWTAWNEVGSYWLYTSASADITLAVNTWAMFKPSAVSDIYTFDLFPFYDVIPENQRRVRTRNRTGTLLSEYITIKDKVTFDLSDTRFIFHKQMREFRRFNTEIKTFFLATYKYNGVDYVPNIWKVQFGSDPDLTMMAAGRQDLFVGSLDFMEV